MPTINRWIEKHPEWFQGSRIDTDDGREGWSRLLDTAFSSVEQTLVGHRDDSFRITQVKEKLGTLTIYFCESALPIEVSNSLRHIMQVARYQSLFVCEICGSSAHLGGQSGLVSVRCSSCAPRDWVDYVLSGRADGIQRRPRH